MTPFCGAIEIVDGISIGSKPREVEENSSDHWPKLIPFILKASSVSDPPIKFILNTSLIFVSSGGVSKVSEIKIQLLLMTVSKFFK